MEYDEKVQKEKIMIWKETLCNIDKKISTLTQERKILAKRIKKFSKLIKENRNDTSISEN